MPAAPAAVRGSRISRPPVLRGGRPAPLFFETLVTVTYVIFLGFVLGFILLF